VDILFISDTILNFFFAYERRNGEVITNHKLIAKKYLKTWFFFDFISSIPFYSVSGDWGITFQILRVPRLLRFFRFFKIAKWFQSDSVNLWLFQLEFNPRWDPSTFRLLRYLFGALSLAHFCACMFYLAGDSENPEVGLVPLDMMVYRFMSMLLVLNI